MGCDIYFWYSDYFCLLRNIYFMSDIWPSDFGGEILQYGAWYRVPPLHYGQCFNAREELPAAVNPHHQGNKRHPSVNLKSAAMYSATILEKSALSHSMRTFLKASLTSTIKQ